MTWLVTDRRWDWDPAAEFRRLRDEVERVFSGTPYGQPGMPAINVWSDSDRAVVTAQLPGVTPEDLRLSVTGAALTLEGERRNGSTGEETVYHRRERGYGKFSRTIRLPFEIESDKVKAQYRMGVLMVDLPRKEETKPRQIAVQGE